MKKIKLLFILQSYSHGGTNKSLQNLLSLLNTEVYEYYIFSTNKDDVYKKIFSQYNIINCPKLLQLYSTSQSIIIRAIRLIDRNSNYILFNLLTKLLVKKLEKKIKFDKVIAFEEGIYIRLIASAFNTNKISWIHCDYKSYHKMFNTNLTIDQKSFSTFDKIICVSQTTAKSFLDLFPILEAKTDYIYNILNSEEIIINANHHKNLDSQFTNQDFTIISIGRLHTIKQFEKIPDIVKQIYKEYPNIKLKWFIIGDGDLSIKNKIIKKNINYNLHNIIICLGAKDNPYPYIKKSNLLVVTSLSEAYPCVINEAKILKIPILTTNFDSAHEIVDENTGIIAPLNEFPDIIPKMINNIDMTYSNLKDKIAEYKFNNDESVKKLNILFQSNDSQKNL